MNLEEKRYWKERDFVIDLLKQLPCYVFWKDVNCVYLGCNDLFAQSAGLSTTDEIIGKTDYDLPWGKYEGDLYRADDQKVIESKIPKLNIEEPQTSSDGKNIVLLTSKVPLLKKSGEVVGVLGIYSDITDRKNMEDELKETNKKLDLISRAKTEFIANMSHDVKTPLSGIISLAQLLNSRVQPEYRDLTQNVLDASQQLMIFFENCIELSKLEGGSITLSEENFNLKRLLNEIFHLFQPSVKAKGLELHLEYMEQIPKRLFGNRATLYRTLLNLVGNAVKFTSEGSVTISVKLSQKSTDKTAVVKLTITDTGIGIPEDKQQAIFERFSRAVLSYQGTYEGHGIGLYIVQKFVKAMGGEIRVTSQEGVGSQFTVVIPFQIPLLADDEYEDDVKFFQSITADSLAQLEFLTGTGAAKNAEANFNQSKVLLVEDSLIAQKGAILLLQSLGCDVTLAECGEKAISLFKPGQYALVYMDIGLPDLKGYEVARRFREMEKGTSFSVPILGLSAHATEDEQQFSAAAGMQEMLSKPLLEDSAKRTLTQYVKPPTCPDLFLMENQLRVIDLPKVPSDPSNNPADKITWAILSELITSLREVRTDIEKAYQARDIASLINKIHQFRGGVCYTKTPHLLQALETMEKKLRNGESDQLDALYSDLLKSMALLEKTYHSLEPLLTV